MSTPKYHLCKFLLEQDKQQPNKKFSRTKKGAAVGALAGSGLGLLISTSIMRDNSIRADITEVAKKLRSWGMNKKHADSTAKIYDVI